ncbi:MULTISPECIES: hypothetical protein [Subtercola]|uniref:Uncharacterized protein n=1 Tax=Subtercola vilae TaxID=2056433 RepID=A0A4T2C877_9MICO|nr:MULTISPECIES: hypothetical protein [Subtercola]MEA9986441.1 hypothetical protein [Subtercola sp. RTI3]TIH40380.1 hypothetical protein D4765_02165 [Subtercola vilae]
MSKFRNLAVFCALTGALIGGTGLAAHAAEDGSGMPDQTQTDDGTATSGGGGDVGDGSGSGGSTGGGGGWSGSNGWDIDDALANGAVPKSMAPYYTALGYYSGVYFYGPSVGGVLPTQGDVDMFNAEKGGGCDFNTDGNAITCPN